MAEKGFDLATVDQTETTVIPLVHPSTGDEIGASVTVYGQDSDVFRAESRKCEHRIGEYARRNRGKMMPPEDRERMDRAKVVKCTKSLDGLVYQGQPLTDPAEVYARFPWIYEQVVQGIMDRANFIKGSSAS